MAISKLILNGVTQMDVTSDTVTAGSMLSGTTATKNDGTKVTGNIVSKSATDLTASGSTVTVPAGYYSSQVTKNVASATHPNPTADFNTSTGVFTASHTQTAGYVAAGTTTSTYSLTTQAAQTITPGTTNQTISSNRWLTGAQTILGDSNLVASNIASGVSIFGVEGTHQGQTYTATISGTGIYDTRIPMYNYVQYNSTRYYTNGNTFQFTPGSTLTCKITPNTTTATSTITIDGDTVISQQYAVTYNYVLPNHDIIITFSNASWSIDIKENAGVDIPIFTAQYDLYGLIASSISCDKTFQQCGTLINNDYVYAGVLTETSTIDGVASTHALEGSEEYFDGGWGIIYYNSGNYEQSIGYKSNGTFVIIDPNNL